MPFQLACLVILVVWILGLALGVAIGTHKERIR